MQISVLWRKIKLVYDESLCLRLLDRFLTFLACLFASSVFFRGLFVNDTDKLKESFVYKFIHAILSVPERIRDRGFADYWNSSAIVILIKNLPQTLFSLRPRDIGYGVISGCAVNLLIARELTTAYYALFAFAALCLFIKTKIYDLCAGSAVCNFFCHVFDFGFPRLKTKKPEPFIPVVYGIYGGFIFAALPFTSAAVLFVFPCILIVIAYPYIAVLAAVALMPFVPTMLMAAIIVGIFCLFLLKLLTDKRYSIKLDILGLFIIIYIFITLFMGFASLAPAASINIALLTSLFMAVYFPVVSMTTTKKRFESLILVFSTSALFTALYGFMQILSGQRNMTWVDKELFIELGFRVFSTFANPNVYGAYLLLAIPIAFIGFVLAKRFLLKFYYLAVAGLLVVILGLTYSRGCYLAVLLAAVVFVFIMDKRLIAFLSLGVFIIPAIIPVTMFNRLMSIGNLEDSSSVYRLSIYQASIRVIRRFWYTGIGQGSEAFNTVYRLFSFNAVPTPHSHNLFLQVFIETGIFGFAAFIGIIYCFFKTLLPFIKKTENIKYKYVAAILVSMMIGFLLQSIFDYTFYNYKIHMLFFAGLALAKTCVTCGERK